MTYFVIHGSEDGPVVRECSTAESLKQYFEDAGLERFRPGFGTDDRDPNYWPEDMALVIKGEVVVPKPKEVVKDWDV